MIRNSAGERRESRQLAEAPALSLNLPRALAARGLEPGQTHVVSVFDPATLRNTPMTVEVQAREMVRAAGRPVPAFRVEERFAGVTTRSWITDVGEVVREESPMGLQVVRETQEQAQALAVPGAVQADMLEASALVPVRPRRIDDPRTVARLRLRIDGLTGLDAADLSGAGQSNDAGTIEVDGRARPHARPGPGRPRAVPGRRGVPGERRPRDPRRGREGGGGRHDAAAARRAAGPLRPRDRREAADREPALGASRCSGPGSATATSTRRSTSRWPARWACPRASPSGSCTCAAPSTTTPGPRSGSAEAPGRGLWLPVDPTLNQFPADATHVRLARGGLDRQAAIVGLIGTAKLDILDVELRPGAVPVLVGRDTADLQPLDLPLPRRDAGGCWSQPPRRQR